ncbi:PAS domain-containing protein [Halorhabdus sp. CBA1104]|uniref:PAS domain-containing protein n=1 Tax=Halorhabdus sp. CBA1104 TaxID=1380432 RepID=UPI0018A6CEE9|nr:PAS domain-containing protein [Halorhabdus sp. CBA1104]
MIARDVTERRERQQELHETKHRLSLALQSGDSGVWEWNVETDEIRWNDSMERLVGLEPGEFDGTYAAFTDHVHPADLSAFEETIERTLKNEGTIRSSTGRRRQTENRFGSTSGVNWLRKMDRRN